MKQISIFFLAFALLGGLGSCQNNAVDNRSKALPVLDFRQDIPEKEVTLQHLGTVQYLRFNAPEDVLLGDHMRLAPSKMDHLFFYSSGDGDVLRFDKKGTFISRFNHKGQGGDEYTDIRQFVADPERGEVFICAFNKVLVYDLEGTYKRTLAIPDSILVDGMASLNKQTLLFVNMKDAPFVKEGVVTKFNEAFLDPNAYPFVLMDKETGETIENLPLVSEGRFQSFLITMRDNKPFFLLGRQQRLFPTNGVCLMSEPASDTLYALSDKQVLAPLLTRLPSTKEKEGKISCALMAATPRTMLIEALFLKDEGENNLKRRLYIYNVPEDTFVSGKLISSDFEGHDFMNPVVANNKLYFVLYPNILLEAMKSGKLSGKLLEIASALDEEDNPVLMIVDLEAM